MTMRFDAFFLAKIKEDSERLSSLLNQFLYVLCIKVRTSIKGDEAVFKFAQERDRNAVSSQVPTLD
jgi:hypothetical protein